MFQKCRQPAPAAPDRFHLAGKNPHLLRKSARSSGSRVLAGTKLLVDRAAGLAVALLTI
jgi:hypothetical protein